MSHEPTEVDPPRLIGATQPKPSKRFVTSFASREHFYSLGTDTVTGQHFLSIPVSVRIADYLEYYALTPEQYQHFTRNPQDALRMADECRAQKHDELLIIAPPKTNRGTAV